jgi:hypothetical protein
MEDLHLFIGAQYHFFSQMLGLIIEDQRLFILYPPGKKQK